MSGAVGDEGGRTPPASFDPGTPGQPQTPDASVTAALEYITRTAPIPAPAAVPAGTTITSFLVTWDNMINPPEPKPEGETK